MIPRQPNPELKQMVRLIKERDEYRAAAQAEAREVDERGWIIARLKARIRELEGKK